jgi:hypothetical protein
MTEARLRRVASNLLCLAGLAAAIGHVTGLFPLTILGQERYIVSPIPIVFSQADGRETIAARFAVRIETDAGRVYEFDEDGRGFAHHIRGPFLRRVSYVARLMYFRPHADRQTASILRFALCGGALVDELRIEGKVRRIVLRGWSAIEREQIERTFVLECAE